MKILTVFLVLFLTTPVFGNSDFQFKNKKYELKRLIQEHNIIDRDTILFKTRHTDGDEIKAFEYFDFVIPEKFKHRVISHIKIKYRKDKKYVEQNVKWDKNNAWLHIFLRNKENKEWKIWSDQFGSGKRSALRNSDKPKKNTFYNCSQLCGFFNTDRVRLINEGEGELSKAIANIHEIRVFFLSVHGVSNVSPLKTYDNAIEVNANSIKFVLDAIIGKELKIDERFKFIIPEKFQNRFLLHAVLKHRKTLNRAINKRDLDAVDPNPAYILFEALNSETNLYHRWADRYGSAKFSEIRSAENPEDEILHNCMKCLGFIKIKEIMLTNTGYGKKEMAISNVHELELVFRPDLTVAKKIEMIYCPGTEFSNIKKGKTVPLFGGGSRIGGKFPGALLFGKNCRLRARKLLKLDSKYSFPIRFNPGKNCRRDFMERIHVSLPENKKFLFFEIAVGDLDITTLTENKDGTFGRLGRSEVSIYLRNRYDNTISIPLLFRGNVGKACLLIASPHEENYVIQKGDELVISSDFDTSFLMGYRLTIKD